MKVFGTTGNMEVRNLLKSEGNGDNNAPVDPVASTNALNIQTSLEAEGSWLDAIHHAVYSKEGLLAQWKNLVLRAANRMQKVVEQSQHLEAMVQSADGTIWGGFDNGLLVQWGGGGTRIRELHLPPAGVAVKCLAAVGSRLWIGYASGTIQVIYIKYYKKHQLSIRHVVTFCQVITCPILSRNAGSGHYGPPNYNRGH